MFKNCHNFRRRFAQTFSKSLTTPGGFAMAFDSTVGLKKEFDHPRYSLPFVAHSGRKHEFRVTFRTGRVVVNIGSQPNDTHTTRPNLLLLILNVAQPKTGVGLSAFRLHTLLGGREGNRKRHIITCTARVYLPFSTFVKLIVARDEWLFR